MTTINGMKIKRKKNFHKGNCVTCGKEQQVLKITKTLRCWECISNSLRQYSREHNATSTHPIYMD